MQPSAVQGYVSPIVYFLNKWTRGNLGKPGPILTYILKGTIGLSSHDYASR